METAKTAKHLSGDKPYQERARRALPLLVRQALAGTPVYYSDLASELEMPNPRNLNYVLGSIGTAIERLSVAWKEKVPPIQCIVINKATGLPGEGIGWFLLKKEDFRKLSRRQRRSIVDAELQRIYAYPKWDQVLAAFNLDAAPGDFTPLIQGASTYGGAGEGPEHRALKEYVAKHPEIVGLPASAIAHIEYALPSGDSIDVLFEHQDDWVAVEVKPSSSPMPDMVRGLFQCVKYRAVIEAVQATTGKTQNASAILVLGGLLPSVLMSIKNTLGIPVFEEIVPR